MRKFQLIHNITSPYRMHLFELMWKELQRRDIEFHVEFLSRSGAHRPKSWQADTSTIPFPHSFSTDIGLNYKGVKWHFNPAINAKLALKKNDYLLIGAPWATITAGLGSVFNRSVRTIAWIEGTSWHTKSFSGRKSSIKRYLLGKYDYIAVPGKEGTTFIEQLMGPENCKTPEIVYLPNVVDGSKFGPAPVDTERRARMRQELGLTPDSRVAIWPARLISEGYVDKGIPEFLQKLSPEMLKNWKILILGDGPLRGKVEQTIADRNLGESVILHTFVDPDEMPNYYWGSDIFLLASLKEPGSISTIEALKCGLPILLSNRVGHYPEALRSGINGWGFDPYDPDQIESAMASAFSASPDVLKNMGRESQKIAAELWDTETVVAHFLDQVL